jgi:uncharacterized damage-inducible protein DinB
MSNQDSTLTLFYENWKLYQDHLREALVPLSDADMKLKPGPNLRTLGELVQHLVAARVWWFHSFLGEGGESLKPYESWDDRDAPIRPLKEVLEGVDRSWAFVQGCLDRWSDADLQKTFPHEWRGEKYDLTRSWVVWHVLEHDLHHGGEISLTMGMHGKQAPDI